MSTTLTNGLKLPDKGSVDWYADMQNNYNILDGAVGTIAEHTSALSGKAPLVHTHTKSDITDFPAYGTTAGTICEGNDSRLSDARTPVAHTHLTTDVTDLLNTAHEWTKAQTYSDVNAIITKNNDVEIGNEPSAYNEQRFIFRDKNNQQIAAIKYQNQLSSKNVFNNSLEFSATDKFKDGVRDATGTAITTILRIGLWNDGTKYIYNEGRWRSNLLPFGNNTNDLGSSSYQWNNLYANNYYYNGVAWGLDKANVWTQPNYFTKDLIINSEAAANTQSALSGSKIRQIIFNDSSDSNYFFRFRQYVDASSSRMQFNAQGFDSNNQAYSATFVYRINSDGSSVLYPGDNNQSLGTSTNKWKSLNGINPGALSLPSGGTTENTDWFNVAGNILPTGGNATNFSWGQNFFTPSKDGWLALTIIKCSAISVWCDTLKYGMSVSAPDALLNKQVIVPVVANRVYEIRINGDSWFSARLIMPKGNV